MHPVKKFFITLWLSCIGYCVIHGAGPGFCWNCDQEEQARKREKQSRRYKLVQQIRKLNQK